MAGRIAVIGGGPKAAALAAKAWSLRELGAEAPEIVILEPSGIGAAWSGGDGYTDGLSRLCTPAERDLGFPYDVATFGSGVAAAMLSGFSWHQFLVGRPGAERYAAWVNRGSQRPAHALFAEYLRWAVARSDAEVVTKGVAGLRYNDDGWRITLHDGEEAGDRFDGVVVTGSGPPLRLDGADESVLDGHDFWLRGEEVGQRLSGDRRDEGVVIVGAGGTAASVAAWLARQPFGDVPIRVVGREATLYGRSFSYFEDRMFGDDGAWEALGTEHRTAFLDRLGRGVVWQDIIDVLRDAPNLIYTPGSARGFERKDGELLLVMDRSGGGLEKLAAALFVDCRGFDAWWFASLFDPQGLPGHYLRDHRGALDAGVDETLALSDPFPHPGLHVPMRAALVGPAAPNLMALGWMSDRILRAYVSDSERLILLGID